MPCMITGWLVWCQLTALISISTAVVQALRRRCCCTFMFRFLQPNTQMPLTHHSTQFWRPSSHRGFCLFFVFLNTHHFLKPHVTHSFNSLKNLQLHPVFPRIQKTGFLSTQRQETSFGVFPFCLAWFFPTVIFRSNSSLITYGQSHSQSPGFPLAGMLPSLGCSVFTSCFDVYLMTPNGQLHVGEII